MLQTSRVWSVLADVKGGYNNDSSLYELIYDSNKLMQGNLRGSQVYLNDDLKGCQIKHSKAKVKPRWKGKVVHLDPERKSIVFRLDHGHPPAPQEAFSIVTIPWLGDLMQWLLSKPPSLSVQSEFRTALSGKKPISTKTDLSKPVEADSVFPVLRKAQKRAANLPESLLSVLWGPPGTGKTYLLAYMAARLSSAGKNCLILSPTKVAADQATLSVDSAFESLFPGARFRGDVLRIDLPELYENFEERGKHLLVWADEDKKYKKLVAEARRRLNHLNNQLACVKDEHKPQIVTAIEECESEIEEAREQYNYRQKFLITNARVLCATTRQDQARDLAGAFDFVFVDEASMVSLSDGMAVLLRAKGNVLFAGDHKQMGPISLAANSNPKRGSSSRSQELAVQWLKTGIMEFLESEHSGKFRMEMLDESSRMNAPLCNAVSLSEYGGKLKPVDPPESGIPPHLPHGICVLDSRNPPDRLKCPLIPAIRSRNTSAQSATYAIALARETAEQGHSVILSSPFRNQANILKRGVGDLQKLIRAGTVHRMQGGEASVSIFDPAIPSNWFISKSPDARKLVNVAASRAQRCFVLCNSLDQLHQNQLFKEYLREADVLE
jgi:hypothetical protein